MFSASVLLCAVTPSNGWKYFQIECALSPPLPLTPPSPPPPLHPPPQASLCTVNIDRGIFDFSEEIPLLPDQQAFMIRLSEKILEHNVKVSDVVERPRSPELSPPGKPSIIEALR